METQIGQRRPVAGVPHTGWYRSLPMAPMVGRAVELCQLEEALALAGAGQGCAVFLVGEAGIGKTRLASEVIGQARARGFRVLEARASPPDSGLAYAPILASLGAFFRGLDRVHLTRLVSGLNDLGRLFTYLRLPSPEPLGDPGLERTRLCEAVARLLERLSLESPVVFFLDDLHCADRATLDLLHYLARGLRTQSVLFVLTCRPHEAQASRVVAALLTSLKREGVLREIPLVRLTPEAVKAMVQGILGPDAPNDLLALVERRAQGTPLYVEALIDALIDTGHLVRDASGWTLSSTAVTVLPPSVRDLIVDRLERLSASDRHVVDLVAVGGGTVSHAVLCGASGLGDDALLAAVRSLRSAGLVGEDLIGGEVVYNLAHPFIRDVAYAELPEMVRRREHVAFASTLEEIRPKDQSLLAHHYRGAGTEAKPDRALEVLLSAGERARELDANEEAAQHFGAALLLVRAGHGVDQLPRVLERLGEAWQRLGEDTAAIEVWSEARREYEHACDFGSVARLHLLLADLERDRGHYDVAVDHLSSGLTALAGREPSLLLADLNLTQADICWHVNDVAGLARAAEQLSALAKDLASQHVAAAANMAEAALLLVQGEYAQSREKAFFALSIAEQANDVLMVHFCHEAIAWIALTIGDHRLAREHAECSLDLARRRGGPSVEVLPTSLLVHADLLAGAWDEALRRSGEAVGLGRHTNEPYCLASTLGIRAIVLGLRGNLADAEACLAEGRGTYNAVTAADSRVLTTLDTAEAVIALETEDWGRAAVVAARLASALVQGTGGTLPLSLGVLAEARVLAGKPESALFIAERLLAVGPSGTPYRSALALRVEGLVRGMQGDNEKALHCLASAAEGFAAMAMPFEGARARLEWARLAAAGDPQGAGEAAKDSLAVFSSLSALRYVSLARRLLNSLGMHPTTSRHASQRATVLSDREIEVARLVAAGLTNAEIAERLVISPRTVTTHLDRIYGRLGINSRTSLARYVIESGLLQPSC